MLATLVFFFAILQTRGSYLNSKHLMQTQPPTTIETTN